MPIENAPSISTSNVGSNSRRLQIGLVAIISVASGFGLRTWLETRDIQQARTAAKQSRFENATNSFQRHLRKHPEDARARLEFASMLRVVDSEAALRELRLIPSDAPEFLEAARQVSAIALELGRDYDAVGPLLALAERLPSDAEVQFSLAGIRFRERDYEAALQHAQRCRDLRPTHVEAYLFISESLDELKRPEEMIAPLEAALKIDPELPQAHLNLSYALQLVGHNDEALTHVNWFLKRHPNTASALRILALIQRATGHSEDALTSIRKALRIQPRNLECVLIEGELLLFMRRAEEAFQRTTEMVRVLGDERRLLALQVRSAALAGHRDEAQVLQARLTKLMPAD